MQISTVVFVLLLVGLREVSEATTAAQTKCADLVYKWLTNIVSTDQSLKVLSVIHDGIYNQLPTANITDSVCKQVLGVANAQQAAIVVTAISRLKSDLGSKYDETWNTLWSNLNSVLDETFNELKVFSKNKANGGKLAKSDVINDQYKKLNKILYKKTKKAFNKCSKAIDAKYWTIVEKDFGPILNFDQYQ